MIRLNFLFLWLLLSIIVSPAGSYSQGQRGTPGFLYSDQPEETYVHEHYHSVQAALAEYQLSYEVFLQARAAGEIEVQ